MALFALAEHFNVLGSPFGFPTVASRISTRRFKEDFQALVLRLQSKTPLTRQTSRELLLNGMDQPPAPKSSRICQFIT